MAPSVTARRSLGIDILRVVAVVIVLTAHMPTAPDAGPIDGDAIWWGSSGVDLFFVLSGYLVSGLLFAEFRNNRTLSVGRFYVRRGWKIYPPFLVFLLFTGYMQFCVVHWIPPVPSILSECLFLQSYVIPFWNHTWSLAVEEHFYVALPLLLLLLVRRSPGAIDPFRSIPRLVLACCVFCLAARTATFLLNPHYSLWTHRFPTHLRIDALLVGVGIAYQCHFHPEWFQRTFARRSYPLLGAGIAAIVAVNYLKDNMGVWGSFYYHSLGLVFSYVGASLILIGVLTLRIPQNVATFAAAKIGSYSYSIYLWHMATSMWLLPGLKQAGWSWGGLQLVFWSSAFVIGIAMAKLVESPLLALRERWAPSRSLGEPTLRALEAAPPSPGQAVA